MFCKSDDIYKNSRRDPAKSDGISTITYIYIWNVEQIKPLLFDNVYLIQNILYKSRQSPYTEVVMYSAVALYHGSFSL